MKLPLLFAWRYLFAHKSHNVINVISAISAVGMAVGTAALILILSVYNGFDRIIKDNISDLDPDLRIQATEGKFFAPDSVLSLFSGQELLKMIPVLEDNVFVSYDEGQTIVKARGVPDDYISGGVMATHLREGSPSLKKGDIPLCSVGAGVADRLSLSPRFVERVQLFYPDRNAPVSLSNPSASLREMSVFPASTFSISSDIDNSLIIVPMHVMRELLEEDGVSGIEIRIDSGAETRVPNITPMSQKRMVNRLKREMKKMLGPKYQVLNRYQMHPTLFRMMKIEKAAIFLILLFVVIIVAFNIFGSLSMLIIEKSDDMSMLRAMGGSDKMVRNIFRLEGWLISLLGLAAGLTLGIGLALLQQHFGLVRLPGNFLIDAYPVELHAIDVMLTACGVSLIGFLVSLFAAPSTR